MGADLSTVMIIAALLVGGSSLGVTGWRMELAAVRASRTADEPLDEEGSDDDRPSTDA